MQILITGTECTGKSTLAAALSLSLAYPWLPEYARTYLREQGPEYTESDLLKIAQGHHRLVTTYAATHQPHQPLILDTYLLNLKIWSEVKYGACDPWITKQLSEAHYDKIFLCVPDLPWVQDGLRENPEKAEALHQRFVLELEALEQDYILISGQGDQRLQSALAALGH